jgi:hypothetical protein
LKRGRTGRLPLRLWRGGLPHPATLDWLNQRPPEGGLLV